MIRITLTDNQTLVRASFRALLKTQPNVEIIKKTANGTQTVTLAHKTNIVLINIRIPKMDNIKTTHQINTDPSLTHVQIVILTTFDLDEYVFKTLRASANKFLVKNTKPIDLLKTIHIITNNKALLSPNITQQLITNYTTQPTSAPRVHNDVFTKLTKRKHEIVALVTHGLTNHEITESLMISPATTKTHVSRALNKLGARDRAQLVVTTYQSGLVRP